MTSLLEAQEKAQRLREQRLKATDEKLKSDMEQIFSATESSLTEKAKNLSRSISKTTLFLRKEDTKATAEISEQIKTSKESLKAQQSEATAEISEQIKTYKEQLLKEHTQVLKEFHTAHKKQVESLQASLKESTRLSEEIAKQSNLKTALISSNIVLISAAIISFISVIWMTYAGSSKYQEIKAKEARLQQIDLGTQEKIQEYKKLIADIYQIRSNRGQ